MPRTAYTGPSSVLNVTFRSRISRTDSPDAGAGGAPRSSPIDLTVTGRSSDRQLLRIERVAQAVTDEVHAQHREHDREPGNPHEDGYDVEQVLASCSAGCPTSA